MFMKPKQFVLKYTEDSKDKVITCKGFGELFRKLEHINWLLLNGVDVSSVVMEEA